MTRQQFTLGTGIMLLVWLIFAFLTGSWWPVFYMFGLLVGCLAVPEK